MRRTSRTMIQPVFVPQLVSRTIVPGRYRRAAGTMTSSGPRRNEPASRSSIAPKMLAESSRGRHIHSMAPLGATSANDSQSERKAYSAMGGNGDCSDQGEDDDGMQGDTTVGRHGEAGHNGRRRR